MLGRDANIESLYLDNFYCAFDGAEVKQLLAEHYAANPYAFFLKYWETVKRSPTLGRLLYADQKTYLVELLMKQDQMSMACSIESRVPFLDHLFVEFAASVPPHMKLRGKEGKYILKKAVTDLLPESIIYRQKQGFPTPIGDWLRRDRAKVLVNYLRDPDGILATYVNQEFLGDLLEKHYSGKYDATDRIWRLLSLQVWGDMYLTGRREQFWDGLMQVPTGATQTA